MTGDRLLLKTSRFEVRERTYQTPNGEVTRPVIDHPGAVCILPFVDESHLVFVRNHRAAVGEQLIEIPAGTLEPGEDSLTTARRELAEETGYTAAEWEHLCDFWMSPGILKERMHLYVARALTAGQQALDVGEQIEPLILEHRAALAMVRSGQIQDAKTLVALLYYEQFLSGRCRERGDC